MELTVTDADCRKLLTRPNLDQRQLDQLPQRAYLLHEDQGTARVRTGASDLRRTRPWKPDIKPSRPGLCRQETPYWKWATAMNTAKQAMENMEYVRRLLEEMQAGFSASVELLPSVAPHSASSADTGRRLK